MKYNLFQRYIESVLYKLLLEYSFFLSNTHTTIVFDKSNIIHVSCWVFSFILVYRVFIKGQYASVFHSLSHVILKATPLDRYSFYPLVYDWGNWELLTCSRPHNR